MKEGRNFQIIEWEDLDKKTFYAYGLVMSGALRLTIYPMNLVKTRLQAQEGKVAYNGLFDAFKKIGQREGIRGFYKGFPISLIQVFAGQLYITTYEKSKQTLFNNQPISIQHLCGGFLASTVSQTIMVPVDVIAQHQQVIGSSHKMTSVDMKNAKNGVSASVSQAVPRKSSLNIVGQAVRIGRHILRTEGLSGLYRGYLVSLCTYGSNSGFYWAFYYLYSELFEGLLPNSDSWLREQFRIFSAGISASTTAVLLTNPLDVVRTRYQLQVKSSSGSASSWQIFRCLIEQEGYRGLTRGLTVRIAQSSLSSCFIVLAYEYIKKASLKKGADPAHRGHAHGAMMDHSHFGDIDDLKMVSPTLPAKP